MEDLDSLKKFWNKKKVFITGHTGFKGAWLCIILRYLNSKVYGYALKPEKNSLFNKSQIQKKLASNIYSDISDINKLKNKIKQSKPEIVFHLAAQPLVLESYKKPLKTFSTNIIGTLNLLESIREIKSVKSVVIITTDKVYKINKKNISYKELDQLGGLDPYSASKGAAEIIFHSYYESYFKQQNSNLRIASARAGNVMGGGDWADRRIVPDCMKSWSRGEVVEIRSPNSTRPWQHVLEPISGYISLAANLYNNISISGESFNFGPSMNDNQTVESLVREMTKSWPGSKYEVIEKNTSHHEAGLLALNCMLFERQFSAIFCLVFNGSFINNQRKSPLLAIRLNRWYCLSLVHSVSP